MANMFDELENESAIDKDNNIVATDDESSSIPQIQAAQFQDQLVEPEREPLKMDLSPEMDETPFDESKLEQPKKSTAERYLEALSKVKNEDDTGYNQSLDKGNKLKLYGNLLSSFNNTIKNSMATVVPNFQEEKAVPEALRQQGSDLVSEFYKRRQNERAQQDQAAANIKNLNAMESSDLDLENKKQLNLPGTKLADLYGKLAQANESLQNEDLSTLSAAQASEVAKEARLANQMKLLQDFRNRSLDSRVRGQNQRDAMLDLLRDKFGYKKDEDQQRQEGQVVQNFNKDKVVQKANEQIAAADNIVSLVNSNNPIGHAAVPTFMARAAGEVGALTEADKAPFGGTKALTGRIQQVISDYSSGKLTPENKKFILDLTGTLKKSAAKNIENVAKREVPKLSKANKIDKKDIQDLLLPPVKVRAPDGSIKNIPRSRLQDALNAGGEEVDE
jgi:hypothetical protein